MGDPPAHEGPPAEAGIDGDTATTSGGSDASSSRLQLSVDDVTVLRGNSGVLQVRLAGVDGRTVSLRVLDRPSGFGTSEEILAPANADSFEIPFQTDASTPYGQAELQLVASTDGGATTVTATARVMVRGVTGALDTSYGHGGTAEAPPGTLQLVDFVPDGDALVVAGSVNTSGADSYFDNQAVVARLTPEGNLDSAFGEAGIATWPRPMQPGLPYYLGAEQRHVLQRRGDGWGFTPSYWLDGVVKCLPMDASIPADGKNLVLRPAAPSVADEVVGRIRSFVDGNDGSRFWFDSRVGTSVSMSHRTRDGSITAGWGTGAEIALGLDTPTPSNAGPPASQAIVDQITVTTLESVAMSSTRVFVLVRGRLANGGLASGFAYSVITFDRQTGQILANAYVTQVPPTRTAAVRMSQVDEQGGVVVTDANGANAHAYRLSADGLRSAGQADWFVSELGGDTGAVYGELPGGRRVLVHYTNADAKLHLSTAVGRVTPTTGVVLTGWSSPRLGALLGVVSASADRIVLVFGSDGETPGWALRRYWL